VIPLRHRLVFALRRWGYSANGSIEQLTPERLLVRYIANATIELGVDDAIEFIDVPPGGSDVGQFSFFVLDLSKLSIHMQHVAATEQAFDAATL